MYGFLNYDGFVKLDDSDFKLEDLKEFLASEMPIYDTPRQYSRDSAYHIGRDTIKSVYGEAVWCMNICIIYSWS